MTSPSPSDPGSAVASTPPATAAQSQSREPGPSDAPEAATLATAPIECDISPRALRPGYSSARERAPSEPLYRPLRVYTQDPTVSRRDGGIATINVDYEPLTTGPIGGLLEVVDEGISDGRTPSRRTTVNLDAPFIMLTQGHEPSPSDPFFRAQNAYAICSTTYAAFRHALGRDLVWGFNRGSENPAPARLRLRTSFSSERNAYYDSQSGELRFGVFVADRRVEGNNIPLGLVYTALQHDVVVHEMSHALLDGLRANLLTPTNPDVLAFHEAFADVVAIFQRFTYAAVVRAGISASRGKLRTAPTFTDIARQFGQTVGLPSALRSAVLGANRSHGDSSEPHIRGEVLVAAVFEAFATIYDRKTTRVVRLASEGTGELRPGALPDLLVDELADQARKLASQFLSICIRAIDYCPPVDITFGEYLRALITADMDLVPDDPWGYREAIIDGFRSHGIYPMDQRSLAEETLRWRPTERHLPPCAPLSFGRLRFRGDPATPADANELKRQAQAFGRLVGHPDYRQEFGLLAPGSASAGADRLDRPIVASIRTARRVGPDGQIAFDLVAEVIQRRTVAPRPKDKLPAFHFYGGATVILDPAGRVRYVIRKRIDDDLRLARQANFITEAGKSLWLSGPGQRAIPKARPFRMIHEMSRTTTCESVQP